MTSIGAGDSANQAPIVFRILMSTVMRSIFNDKNNQEQLFLGPGGPGRDLEFCVVRPGGLGLGPPTGVVNVIDGEGTHALTPQFPLITVTVHIPTFQFPRSTRALTLFAHPVSSITAGSIARADVADFCLGALFEESFPYVGKAPCISSVGGTSRTKDRGDKGMMEA